MLLVRGLESLLGVLLGTLAAMIEEVMSITAIVFLLIILLFGFDSAGQVNTRRKLNYG